MLQWVWPPSVSSAHPSWVGTGLSPGCSLLTQRCANGLGKAAIDGPRPCNSCLGDLEDLLASPWPSPTHCSHVGLNQKMCVYLCPPPCSPILTFKINNFQDSFFGRLGGWYHHEFNGTYAER